MNRVAVVHNPHSPPSVRLSHELAAWLAARGVEAWPKPAHRTCSRAWT
jgi:hypothetical protein